MLNACKWLMIPACAVCAGQAAAETPSAATPPSYPALVHETASRALHILSSDYPGRTARIHRAGAFGKAAIPPGP